MEISFSTKKLAKKLNEHKAMIKAYGPECSRKLQNRLAELDAAETLQDLAPAYSKPARCHELEGDRKGQLSVDLKHPFRLIFVPDHDPAPQREQGGLDWNAVSKIRIVDVEDTHG